MIIIKNDEYAHSLKPEFIKKVVQLGFVRTRSGEYISEYFPVLAKEYGLPRKPSQIIQPYFFGDPHRKATCLWLKNLPPLKATNVVEPTLVQYTCKDGRKVTFDSSYMVSVKKGERGKQRSKTFPGIAKAMAEQWG